MKRLLAVCVAVGLIAVASSAAWAQDPGKVMADVTEKAKGGLANVVFTIETSIVNTQTGGLAVCVVEDGTLMTTALDTNVTPEVITKIEIQVPGMKEPMEGKLLGIDRQTGLTFIKAMGNYQWKRIDFAQRPLPTGQLVASVGLMGRDLGFQPYAGAGYVAAVARAPMRIAYVTGGELTGVGSPVFTPDGFAVGLVREQLFQNFQTATQQGVVPIRMRPVERTHFFIPAEEFKRAIEKIPADGKIRRRSWVGIIDFWPMSDEERSLAAIKVPAVMIHKVVPGTSAEKAGVNDGAQIIGINGKELESFPAPEMVAANLRNQIETLQEGEKVKLTVRVDGQVREVELTAAPWPVRPAEAPRSISRPLGMVLREKVPLDQYLIDNATSTEPGLYVEVVGRNTPAAYAGLRPGDLVLSINGTRVANVTAVANTLNSALQQNPGQAVLLRVQRGSQFENVSIMPPTPVQQNPAGPTGG